MLQRTPVLSAPMLRGARLALLLMFLVNALNFLDRMLFAILQEPIKHDLSLTDFQLGLLGGPAFAILYSVAALPIGRIADRSSRVRVVSAVVAIWSSMTALCGIAGNVVQLAAARFGVSIGEAGCAPAAHSLLSDYYPARRRAGAISIFTSGTSIGTLSAAFVGSALAAAYGWRVTFYACGGLGLLLALAILATLREPARVQAEASAAPSLREVVRALRAKRSFLHLCAGMSLATLSGYAIIQYLTSFLIRAHHLPLKSAASITGLMIGGVGFITTVGFGLIIDRNRGRYPRIATALPAVGLFLGAFAYLGAFLAPSIPLVLVCLPFAVMGVHSYIGAGFAAAQDLAPPRMRSTTAGLLMVIVGLVGYAIGSPIVGLVSDTVATHVLSGTGLTVHGCAHIAKDARCAAASVKGLRWGLIAIDAPVLWAALHFWLASRTFVADMARDPEPSPDLGLSSAVQPG